MENDGIRELAPGKTMYADGIVTFLKKEKANVEKYFWDIDFDKVDFHGCSAGYVAEKVDYLIQYLQFIKKGLKNK